MPHSETRIDPRRLRAVAILRFGTVDALHKRLPLGSRAITNHVGRGLLPPDLAAALQAELGDAWPFVAGEVDTLIDSELPRAA